MKIAILGVGGMLGSGIFHTLDKERFEITPFNRSENSKIQHLETFPDIFELIHSGKLLKYDLIINCIGLIKQLNTENSELIKINSLMPQLLSELCNKNKIKLLHFSTDCVFKGDKGGYSEDDESDCEDLYGKSKYLGEHLSSDALILRTSIIGHEYRTPTSLIDWFLSQNSIRGFANAYFSGLPTFFLGKLINENIDQLINLEGLYHISSERIDKFTLLSIVNKVYKKNIEIIKDESFYIDRSLDCSKIKSQFPFEIPDWDELVNFMHSYYKLYR